MHHGKAPRDSLLQALATLATLLFALVLLGVHMPILVAVPQAA